MHINEQKMHRIYYGNNPALVLYASWKIKNTMEAKTIVAEAFAKLWLNRESIESEDHIRPYLFVTVRNLCNKYLNKNFIQSYKEEIVPSSLAKKPDVYYNIDRDVATKWLREQIKKLPTRLHQVAELWLQNLDDEAIAARLNTQVSNVKVYKSRILQKLKEAKKGLDFDYLVLVLIFLKLSAGA